ncbi:molybdopterin-dependent oxidoreductase [Escherichia coli]|uniref:molybdopterin-dependent oxidoreductase n=1 Tax=Escherichia coli TaxID=562 RepID=UPI0015E5ADD4|nr:molybdopterin-dependent oxidoreductase [Escherichia coli]MBA1655208.1 molybdopterin-dependent oxidoreductase [Escherichia coli]
MKKKIESYQGAAGGWGAVKSVANAVRKQMDIRQDVIAMFDMNKPEGFDCPGCAWPDPKHSASFDICENGAKAIAWEVTDKQVNASFFAENTVQSLLTWGDHELEAAGRLTQPLKYDAVSDCYKPLSWQQAFDEIGARLQSYSDPNQVEFYTSGRTSNEAAFLYQLFAREYGSNNFPDCSNMCHEPTSVGLAASIGVGKGTVLLEDFEKCDLVICIGHNPGTNHPRMLTSLRALVKRGAKMIAINPLQERGLERFTAPQNPFEMLTNSETQLASAYYNVRIGGDMALLKGMMRLLIERDDAASAAGRPSLLDDEFIQTHMVEDYDRIRNDIEAVLPEFADYNQRIRHPGGFHLINAAAERRWMTPSGKANFITSKGLLEDPSSAFNSKLVMATVRSHDQYNTTIYGMDDRYRGVFGQRDVVFMSAKQAKICRVKNGERVNLIALTPDGKRSSRRMDRLKVVIYPMADRSLVTYFPESNHMLTLDNHDPLSGIPGYKSIPVELEPSN